MEISSAGVGEVELSDELVAAHHPRKGKQGIVSDLEKELLKATDLVSMKGLAFSYLGLALDEGWRDCNYSMAAVREAAACLHDHGGPESIPKREIDLIISQTRERYGIHFTEKEAGQQYPASLII